MLHRRTLGKPIAAFILIFASAIAWFTFGPERKAPESNETPLERNDLSHVVSNSASPLGASGGSISGISGENDDSNLVEAYTGFFSRPLTSDPGYALASARADEMLLEVSSVVTYRELVRNRPAAMRSFLSDSARNPGELTTPINFGISPSIPSCIATSVDELKPMSQPGTVQIHSYCDSPSGRLKVVALVDVSQGSMAFTLRNDVVDVRVAPVKGTDFAVLWESDRSTRPDVRSSASF